MNTERFRYRDKDFSTVCNSPVFFLDRHAEGPSGGFSFFTDYVNIVELPIPCAETGGSVMEVKGYQKMPEVRCRYGIGPDADLTEKKDFVSFKTYEVFFTGSYEDGCLAFKKMLRENAPWINRSYLAFTEPRVEITEEACRDSIDRCRRVGFELWNHGTGTAFFRAHDGLFEVNEKRFPKGIAQLKEIIEYAHSKGLAVSVYIGFLWAIWDIKNSAGPFF